MKLMFHAPHALPSKLAPAARTARSPRRSTALALLVAASTLASVGTARADDPPASPAPAAPDRAPSEPTAAPSPDAPPPDAPPASSVPPLAAPAEPAPPIAPVETPPALPSALASSGDGAVPPGSELATDAARPHAERPKTYFSAGLGFAAGHLSYSKLSETRIEGAMLELRVGVAVNSTWSFGFAASSVEMPVIRDVLSDRFAPTAGHLLDTSIHIQAECNSCKPGSAGGLVDRMPLHVVTLGPEVQFTPTGDDGVFLGATPGLAMMPEFKSAIGGALVARAGYRLRFAKVLSASAQLGVNGQLYDGGSALFPFAGVQLSGFITGTR